MYACVFVCGYIVRVGGEQAAKRKKHTRPQMKLDLTVSICVGGKLDGSLREVWGVWYFKRPVFDNTLDKTRFIKTAKCYVRKREKAKAPPFQPAQPQPKSQCLSPVTGCRHCSNAQTALLPSDINTWILSLVEEEIEEVVHRGSGALWMNLNVL